MERYLWIAAAFGLIIRLALAPFFGHAWDMYIWIVSGELVVNEGVNIYQLKDLTDFPWGFYAYPPAWLYWLSLAAWLNTFFNNLNIYVMIIKLPIILADVAIAFILYRISRILSLPERWSRLAPLIWLLNPVTIFITAVWGMFDSLAVLTTMAALYYALIGRERRTGILLGLGTAIKLYPALLIIPVSAYLLKVKKAKPARVFYDITLLATITGVALSLPYLIDPLSFISKLLYHFRNVGQFTYWTGISIIMNPIFITIISNTAFVALFIIALTKMLRLNTNNSMKLINLITISLLVFLSVSSKVNVQYTLWVLPFLLLIMPTMNSREARINFYLLIVAAIMFITATILIPGMYSLSNLGTLSLGYEQQTSGFIGPLLITSALLGGTRYVGLMLEFLSVKLRNIWNINRLSIITLLIIFALFLSLFPTGRGVELPYLDVRVAVPESVESIFGLQEGFDIDSFTMLYNVTHIVIPMGPDVVNTYVRGNYDMDVSRNFRFRLGIDSWSLADLKNLVDTLHARGYRVLLGIYLRSYYHSMYFGIQGYNSTWLVASYGKLADQMGNIYFQESMQIEGRNITYAEFFAAKSRELISDLRFDGVYLMGVNWQSGYRVWESVKTLVNAMNKEGITVFVEIDPLSVDENYLSNVSLAADFMVVKTDPWVRNLRNALIGNFTVEQFKEMLEYVVEVSGSGKARVLFGIYAIDFTEGWLTPAVELQVQVNEFASVNGVYGYAIYHTNRFLPYRITVTR
ncbi:MAG: glycosyltransferase 87 family protein [Aigarchaeota archaeon]|nr:glycosyltransferase 87 family protein [Candidatus Pelearchaeum maunauluense]